MNEPFFFVPQSKVNVPDVYIISDRIVASVPSPPPPLLKVAWLHRRDRDNNRRRISGSPRTKKKKPDCIKWILIYRTKMGFGCCWGETDRRKEFIRRDVNPLCSYSNGAIVYLRGGGVYLSLTVYNKTSAKRDRQKDAPTSLFWKQRHRIDMEWRQLTFFKPPADRPPVCCAGQPDHILLFCLFFFLSIILPPPVSSNPPPP